MEKFLKIVVAVALVIVAVFVSALISGYFVMLLWNWLMTDLFGLKTITYWQGWGLSALGGLLFKPTSPSSKSK